MRYNYLHSSISKCMNTPPAFSANLIYLSHPNTLGITCKVCRHGERRAQSSEFTSCDWWSTVGHLLLFCWFAENGLLCCDRAFAFFRLRRDFSLVRKKGYDKLRIWNAEIELFLFCSSSFLFLKAWKGSVSITQFSERLLLFFKLIRNSFDFDIDINYY